MYYREDQAQITLSLGNPLVAVGGTWKTWSGGNLSAETAKTRPGGMGNEVDIGGPASREDVTLTTQLTDAMVGEVSGLEDGIGKVRAKAAIAFLNANGDATGDTFAVQGTLKDVQIPDLGDGSEAAMLTVVIGADELAV